MANQRLGLGSRGISQLGGISVGDPAGAGAGTVFKRIVGGTFNADTSSVALSSVDTTTFTLSGATTGDFVLTFPSSAFNAGLSMSAGAFVVTTSQVTVSIINETTAAIIQTSGLTHRYLHFKVL